MAKHSLLVLILLSAFFFFFSTQGDYSRKEDEVLPNHEESLNLQEEKLFTNGEWRLNMGPGKKVQEHSTSSAASYHPDVSTYFMNSVQIQRFYPKFEEYSIIFVFTFKGRDYKLPLFRNRNRSGMLKVMWKFLKSIKKQTSWWMGFRHPGNPQALGCIHGVPFGKRTSHFALMPLVGRVSTPTEPTMRKWAWMPVQ